jgi:hypothetical protein
MIRYLAPKQKPNYPCSCHPSLWNSLFFLFNASYYDLVACCPGDENREGCNSGHSDNTLYTFGHVRRPEELKESEMLACTAKWSYNPFWDWNMLHIVDQYEKHRRKSIAGEALHAWRVKTGAVCTKESIASIAYSQKSDWLDWMPHLSHSGTVVG